MNIFPARPSIRHINNKYVGSTGKVNLEFSNNSPSLLFGFLTYRHFKNKKIPVTSFKIAVLETDITNTPSPINVLRVEDISVSVSTILVKNDVFKYCFGIFG